MKAGLKKTQVSLDILTNMGMLLMVLKGIRGGICHVIHRYGNADYKYMKDHEKKWGLQNLKYWAVNNLYGWAMLQMLLVNDFNWFKETSKFHESYKKKLISNT